MQVLPYYFIILFASLSYHFVSDLFQGVELHSSNLFHQSHMNNRLRCVGGGNTILNG